MTQDLKALTDIQLSELMWKQRGALDNDPIYQELTARWELYCQRYPRVFNRKYLDTEVGVGWWATVIRAAERLTAELEAYPDFYVQTLQLKEKFGGMRWYIALRRVGGKDEPVADAPEGLFERLFDIVSVACAEASKLCDVCGEPGKTGTLGGSFWIKTLCDKHVKDS